MSPGQYLTVRLRPDGPDRARGHPQLLALDGQPVRRVPHQRQARAPRGRELVPARPRPRRRHDRGRGAARRLHPARRRAPGRPAQRRRRRDPGPGDAPHPRHARGRAARCGGCTEPATAASTRSAPRSTACSPRCPTRTGSSATAGPVPSETPGAAFDTVGRLSIETVTAAGIPADADYYLCGPDAFMQSLSAALIARGTTPEHVAMEVFGAKAVIVAPGLEGEHPPPHAPTGPPGDGPGGDLQPQQPHRSPWDPSYGNLLEFAEACDIPVSFGCRIGVCHYCETGLLTGEVALRHRAARAARRRARAPVLLAARRRGDARALTALTARRSPGRFAMMRRCAPPM